MPDFSDSDTLRVLPGGRVFRSPNLSDVFVITLAAVANRDSMVAQLRRLPFVEYAEPDQLLSVRTAPASLMREDFNGAMVERMATRPMPGERIPTNEQYFTNQWGLRNTTGSGLDIEATQAWTITTGSSNVTIAVVDGGVLATTTSTSTERPSMG